MIDSGMPAVIAPLRTIDMDLVAVPLAAVAKPRLAAGIGRTVIIASAVVLLLPAILLLGLVAILVPCFLRVPVCGGR